MTSQPTTPDPDLPCAHDSVEAVIAVTLLEDTGRRVADVRNPTDPEETP